MKISAVYDELTKAEQAVYLAELVDDDDKLTYTTTYSRDVDLPYWRSAKYSVGQQGLMIRSRSIGSGSLTSICRHFEMRSESLILEMAIALLKS